jgi:hypothetical protein
MSEKTDYRAMTVNERLFAAGLIEQFDRAVKRKDQSLVIEILAKVDVSRTDATAIVERLIKS